MKDKKKWLDFVHKHFAGMGIGAVTVAMALTVAKGVSGQEAGFDPGDIDTSFSSGLSDLQDKTGYDLSGEGEGNEEVNHNAGGDQEEEKEEEPDRLSELEILPGKTAYINFYYTIDPEIEGMKDQDIRHVKILQKMINLFQKK